MARTASEAGSDVSAPSQFKTRILGSPGIQPKQWGPETYTPESTTYSASPRGSFVGYPHRSSRLTGKRSESLLQEDLGDIIPRPTSQTEFAPYVQVHPPTISELSEDNMYSEFYSQSVYGDGSNFVSCGRGDHDRIFSRVRGIDGECLECYPVVDPRYNPESHWQACGIPEHDNIMGGNLRNGDGFCAKCFLGRVRVAPMRPMNSKYHPIQMTSA